MSPRTEPCRSGRSFAARTLSQTSVGSCLAYPSRAGTHRSSRGGSPRTPDVRHARHTPPQVSITLNVIKSPRFSQYESLNSSKSILDGFRSIGVEHCTPIFCGTPVYSCFLTSPNLMHSSRRTPLQFIPLENANGG